MKLLLNGATKFLVGLLIVGVLLFLPAGTFNYTYGWLFIGLLFIPMLILGIFLFIKSPDLLKKRLNSKEKQKTQKGVIAVSALLFVGGFILAGIDYRLQWSDVPLWITIVSSVFLLLSYGMYAEVMKENAYLSRTIEVQKNQKVIDTGLYGIIRHPMYTSTILLFLSIPFVLGSWWAILCFLPYIFVIIIRINNEEKILEKDLEGYSDYKNKVKYRLIPFIW